MEPAFTIETSKIVGTPGEGFWSQVHTFFPQDRIKKEKRGDLLAVLVVSGAEEGIGAVALGREILGRLHEEYYGGLDGSAFEKLGEAVGKVCLENKGLQIVAASLFGRVLYLAIYGQGKVVLKRGEKLGVVLQGSEQGLQTGSGILEAGDLILLGSEHFFQVVGFGVMKAALENNSLEEAVESLAPIVLGRNNMADAAVILASVKEELQFSIASVPQFEEKKPTLEVKNKPAGFLAKILSKVKLPVRKSFFVRRTEAEKRKKIFFGAALVLLVLLITSLGFGLKRKSAEEKQNKVKNLFSLAEEKFNQGKEIYLLKPADGKVSITEAKQLAEEGLTLKKDSPELILLKEQIEKFLAGTGVEAVLSEVPTFMDLSLIADGASGISLSLLDKDLAILDKENKKIYLLNTEKKSSLVYDFPDNAGKLINSFDSKIMILGEKGITEVDTKNKNTSLKITKDEAWKEIIGFSSFNGNLYLLDKGAGDVWRYLASGESYGGRKSWFVGTPPDLSKAVSIAIDGSVWILEKDKISKFTLSKADDFSLAKMPESFIDPVKIYTSADDQNLYVLDKGRGKIYVIAKTGEFKVSYAWEGIKQTSDLVAIESINKIFLLSGTKIYEIGIK